MDNASVHITLCDPVLKEFFPEVVSRQREMHLRGYLVEFIWIIGRKYQETKRPVDFIIDLLKLNVWDLLASKWTGVANRGPGTDGTSINLLSADKARWQIALMVPKQGWGYD